MGAPAQSPQSYGVRSLWQRESWRGAPRRRGVGFQSVAVPKGPSLRRTGPESAVIVDRQRIAAGPSHGQQVHGVLAASVGAWRASGERRPDACPPGRAAALVKGCMFFALGSARILPGPTPGSAPVLGDDRQHATLPSGVSAARCVLLSRASRTGHPNGGHRGTGLLAPVSARQRGACAPPLPGRGTHVGSHRIS